MENFHTFKIIIIKIIFKSNSPQLFAGACHTAFLHSILSSASFFLHVMIKRECGWVITFVYVPFPNFPLQKANQINEQTKKKQCNKTQIAFQQFGKWCVHLRLSDFRQSVTKCCFAVIVERQQIFKRNQEGIQSWQSLISFLLSSLFSPHYLLRIYYSRLQNIQQKGLAWRHLMFVNKSTIGSKLKRWYMVSLVGQFWACAYAGKVQAILN